MPESSETEEVFLKVLYTLAGVDSQRFVVKPAEAAVAEVCRESRLALVALAPCVRAMRESSPDFARLCEQSADDYALYSADFSEDGFPLQSHGRVGSAAPAAAIGRFCVGHVGARRRELLEVQFHVLPVRKPEELLLEFQLEYARRQQQLGAEWHAAALGQAAPSSDLGDAYLGAPPAVPLSLRAPNTSYVSASSPVRARPTRIAPTPAKRRILDARADRRRRGLLAELAVENQCSNCGVSAACTWRRIKGPDGVERLLCNACGLYYKSKNVMRPSFLWDKLKARSDAPLYPATETSEPSLEAPSVPDALVLADVAAQDASNAIASAASVAAALVPAYEPTRPPETPKPQPMSTKFDATFDKLFALTPEKRDAPSSAPSSAPGSANKWLHQVMNQENSYYDAFLTSPSPKRTRKVDAQALCSSPPTSSTVFSEMDLATPRKRQLQTES